MLEAWKGWIHFRRGMEEANIVGWESADETF